MNLVADALSALDYRELAVTLSEPIEPVLEPLLRLLRTASARGRKVAITTTLTLADRMVRERSAPSMAALLGSVFRINLSVDPWKGQVSPPKAMSLGRSGMGQVDIAELAALLSALQKSSGAERVLIATLSTPRFAEQLLEGPTSLLASLLDLQEVDRIALNGLKPPPPWCDRAFWLRALAGLAPLLRRYLDRKLFLDCYVAARILGVGGCPARPDLSPPPPEAPAGVAFRSCVYQPAPDFVVQSSAELGARLAGFSPPAVCPFPIR